MWNFTRILDQKAFSKNREGHHQKGEMESGDKEGRDWTLANSRDTQ